MSLTDLQRRIFSLIGPLEEAESFIRSQAADDAGCLCYDPGGDRFAEPASDVPLVEQGISIH